MLKELGYHEVPVRRGVDNWCRREDDGKSLVELRCSCFYDETSIVAWVPGGSPSLVIVVSSAMVPRGGTCCVVGFLQAIYVEFKFRLKKINVKIITMSTGQCVERFIPSRSFVIVHWLCLVVSYFVRNSRSRSFSSLP
jgi:hypothetical protein